MNNCGDVKGNVYIMTGKELRVMLSDDSYDMLDYCVLQCHFVPPDTKLPDDDKVKISSGARKLFSLIEKSELDGDN